MTDMNYSMYQNTQREQYRALLERLHQDREHLQSMTAEMAERMQAMAAGDIQVSEEFRMQYENLKKRMELLDHEMAEKERTVVRVMRKRVLQIRSDQEMEAYRSSVRLASERAKEDGTLITLYKEYGPKGMNQALENAYPEFFRS